MRRIASLYQRTSHHSCISYHITSYIPLYDHLYPIEGRLFSYVGYLLSQLKALVTEQHLLCPSTHWPPPATTKVKQNCSSRPHVSRLTKGPGSQLVSNAWSLWPTRDADTSTTWTSPRSLPEMLNLNWRTLSAFSFTTFISRSSRISGCFPTLLLPGSSSFGASTVSPNSRQSQQLESHHNSGRWSQRHHPNHFNFPQSASRSRVLVVKRHHRTKFPTARGNFDFRGKKMGETKSPPAVPTVDGEDFKQSHRTVGDIKLHWTDPLSFYPLKHCSSHVLEGDF